ncbi:MAG: class I SAM-dependent methyltransferase [Clostridium sp.]|nr:class I SAM-dependent methyltransferase [Clostridium sp.]
MKSGWKILGEEQLFMERELSGEEQTWMGKRVLGGRKVSGEVKLSGRLRALARMVTPGSRVCDVGCDHGFLSIYLVREKISPKVIAMDVRKGPLSGAEEHIARQELEDYIETRLSDGLESLACGEADCLVCAGMGGRLMKRILTEGRSKAKRFRELVLQPQSDLPAFRRFLREEGYRTVEENMIEEDGKFYFLMKAVPGGEVLSEELGQDALGQSIRSRGGTEPEAERFGKAGKTEQVWEFEQFGELLFAGKHPVLKKYLGIREKKAGELLEQLRGQDSPRAKRRYREVCRELRLIREAAERLE